jgi:hypothetical protein
VAAACEGASWQLVERELNTIASSLESGGTDNGRLQMGDSCGPGYTGGYCASCAANYFQDDMTCRPCSDDRSTYFLGIFLMTTVLVSSSLAVMLAPGRDVERFVQILMSVQRLGFVGKLGFSAVPDEYSQTPLPVFLRFLSLVNYDFRSLQPGCQDVPLVSPVQEFWIHCLLCLLLLLCFVMSAFVRSLLLHKRVCVKFLLLGTRGERRLAEMKASSVSLDARAPKLASGSKKRAGARALVSALHLPFGKAFKTRLQAAMVCNTKCKRVRQPAFFLIWP